MRNLLTYSPVLVAIISFSSMAFEKVDKTLTADDVSHVIIENQRGNISIQGNDKNNVTVVGKLDEEAKELVFVKDGSTIRVHVVMPKHYDGGWGSNNDGSDLTITLPADLKVSFNGVSADVDVENINKSVDVKTVSGNIAARKLNEHIELNAISGNIKTQGLKGKVYISSVSGDVKDRGSSGRLSIHAVSGDIESRSEAKEVSIETVSGEIELMLGTVEDIEISTVSGDAEVSLTLAHGGLMKMSSVSGDLDAEFNKDISANFKLKTNAGGDIKNRITSDKAERGKYIRNAKLSFDTGDASASVRATTVSGSIALSKR